MPHICPVIEISGNPFDRGVQYGQAAATLIAKGLGHYMAQMTGIGFDVSRIHSVARAYLPRMEDYDAGQVEEMHGIAKGAGVGIEDIAFMNARTEILKLAQNPQLRERAGIESGNDECTSALALPEATRDGRLIIGQNWDWKAECAQSTLLLKIRRDDGPDILTFTEAGGLARSGMNSAGLAVVSNYLDCDRDYRELGVPLLMTRRRILEQTYLAQATHHLYSTRRSGSNNILIGDAGGAGYDMECAPDEVFAVFPSDGILSHANHWIAPAAQAKLRDMGIANTSDTLFRGFRADQLLRAAKGKITRDTFKTVFLDDYQSPYSVCRPVRQSLTMTASATVASIIMEPALGIMEVAILPAQNPIYQMVNLDMDPAFVKV
ncbi:C45 family autoproteolytic acyltransferase/hydolase [Hoeflea alexandrii]|uniref:C45 family autoproteolytic acyltransferase/hydolase n=1 Tax=Hoeflea alexandrii TaxID=288436 RepID=UPI0022AF67BD|nr:C45 family peptidase [Hoeflea alexandrii]MCZ4292227.1 C45 family autoproteolytic acyltransferase/hydrolase [Hoeflea alexandrii]